MNHSIFCLALRRQESEIMLTAFGGVLHRTGRDEWRWADGRLEPRVRDMPPHEAYGVGIVTKGHFTLARVPLEAIEGHQEIAWAMKYSSRVPGRVFVMVPGDTWMEWAADNPVGADWDDDDEHDLIAVAEKMGWKPDEEGRLDR